MARQRWWERRRRRDRSDTMLIDAATPRDEGMAAGTGLLAGETARRRAAGARALRPCPTCGGDARVDVLDLVEKRTVWRCGSCDRRWEEADLPV